MSCVAATPVMRILDGLTGWDEALAESIEGLAGALRLAGTPGAGIPGSALDRWLAPPMLARGCDDCSWFLVTPAPPEARLLALGPCDDRFHPLGALTLVDPRAIAFDRGRLAIADHGADRLWVVDTHSGRITGEAPMRRPVATAFGPGGTVTIAFDNGARLGETDLGGARLASRLPAPPAPVARMAWSADGTLWIATGPAAGHAIFRLEGGVFHAASLADLAAAFAARAITTGWRGFTVPPGSFNWFGRPIGAASVGAVPAPPAFALQGQLLTLPVDSGQPGCRWHRLRVEAEVPPGCSLEIAVSTSDHPAPAAQGLNPPGWAGFDAGTPHPDDWQSIVWPARDALIAQPPGRYLFVRVRMAGPGTATPQLHRVRLDLPRSTSADLLPAVYREDPDGGDFTTRFLALFDTALVDIEDAVVRSPALFDLDGIPDALLPWLGQVIGLALDPGWPADRRRALLKAAAGLYRRRGTPAALTEIIRIATGFDAILTEPGLDRPWHSVGMAHLGRTRLFGRRAARVRLGASALGRARVLSLGDPDLDPHASGAFRLRIDLPALPAAQAARLAGLIESLVPGHLVFDLVIGRNSGFWLLPAARLAFDTGFGTPPRPVLGQGLRLGRGAILPHRSRPSAIVVLGTATARAAC